MSRSVLYMAPLRGVTTAAFRTCFCRHFDGIDTAMAPFIPTVTGKRVRPGLLRELRAENNPRIPVIPQLIGKNPVDFVTMARAVADLGYPEINWNLGCPWPMVIKRGRGAGMLAAPDVLDAFLDRIMPDLTIQLSIKIRLGVKSASDLAAVVPVLNRYPLSEVIVHPRTAAQMYEGSVDLDAFALCADTLVHRLVYSGDITAAADVHYLEARFPQVQRWMLGRGLVVYPLLAADVRGRDAVYTTSRLRAFHDDLYAVYAAELFGPRPLLGRMKELWSYLAQSVPEGPALLKKIQRSTTTAAYEEIVSGFFARDAQLLPGRSSLAPSRSSSSSQSGTNASQR